MAVDTNPPSGSRGRLSPDREADLGGGETPEFRPRRRTKGPLPMIILLVALVIMIGVFAYQFKGRQEVMSSQPEVIETTTDTEYEMIKREMVKAKKLHSEALGLRDSDDVEAFRAKMAEAKEYVSGLLIRLDLLLEPVRTEDGQLPDEYSAYEREYTKLQMWFLDLTKVGGF